MRRAAVSLLVFLVLLTILPLRAANTNGVKYWVYLADKGTNKTAADIKARAQERRHRRANCTTDYRDIPIYQPYLKALIDAGYKPVNQVKFMNAVSVYATPEGVNTLQHLPFVQKIEPVRSFGEAKISTASVSDYRSQRATPPDDLKLVHSQDYGWSYNQYRALNIPMMHDKGLHGEGLLIGVFDAGFDRQHQAFAQAVVDTTWDFVGQDGYVGDTPFHGTACWSVLGGYDPGQVVGGAYAAHYVLARTEDPDSETQIEEDNWAAAAEWAENRGVDMISTSLGYSDWYTPADFDGQTCITTRAANWLASRGVLVVVSAGNNGPVAPSISAPADADSVLAVGATWIDGEVVDFSSRGPTADGRIKPDVCGPGVYIYSAHYETGDQYYLTSGTSLSCPLVAGLAAQVLQANPGLSVMQVIDTIRSSADRAASPDNDYGWGCPSATVAATQGLFIKSVEPIYTDLPPRSGSTGVLHITFGSIIDNPVITYFVSLYQDGNIVAQTEVNAPGAGNTTSADLDFSFTDCSGQFALEIDGRSYPLQLFCAITINDPVPPGMTQIYQSIPVFQYWPLFSYCCDNSRIDYSPYAGRTMAHALYERSGTDINYYRCFWPVRALGLPDYRYMCGVQYVNNPAPCIISNNEDIFNTSAWYDTSSPLIIMGEGNAGIISQSDPGFFMPVFGAEFLGSLDGSFFFTGLGEAMPDSVYVPGLNTDVLFGWQSAHCDYFAVSNPDIRGSVVTVGGQQYYCVLDATNSIIPGTDINGSPGRLWPTKMFVGFDPFKIGVPDNREQFFSYVNSSWAYTAAHDDQPSAPKTSIKVYPNPFNPVANVAFTIAKTGRACVDIYDSRGRLVKKLLDETRPAGDYQLSVPLENQASGVYFIRVRQNGQSQICKAVLLK